MSEEAIRRKAITIEHCEACDYCVYIRPDDMPSCWHVKARRRPIGPKDEDGYYRIPDWCPLPDAEEGGAEP